VPALSWSTYFKAWVQVLHGLDFLHANNVVHRLGKVTVSYPMNMQTWFGDAMTFDKCFKMWINENENENFERRQRRM
jgi:hypothetical protein